MEDNYNSKLWDALERYHPRFYSDDRILEYDILFKYLDEGKEAVSKEDIPWIKTFSSEEEIICRMQIIEKHLHEEISV